MSGEHSEIIRAVRRSNRLTYLLLALVVMLGVSITRVNMELTRRGGWMESVNECVKLLLEREADENQKRILEIRESIRAVEAKTDDRHRGRDFELWIEAFREANKGNPEIVIPDRVKSK